MFATLFKRIPFCIIACFSFCATFICILNFVKFCSSQVFPPKIDSIENWTTTDIIFWDGFLIILFILQHSVMASTCFKKVIYGYRSGIVIERSLYVLMTSLALHIVVTTWLPDRSTIIWHLDTSNRLIWWAVFFVIHAIAWVLLFGAVLTMDLPELLGLKQVYFYCIGADYPMKYKTPEARRLFRAMRHPGTSCLTFILWCHPVMTMDRFLLALSLTLYISFGFNVSVEDYEYIAVQSARKDQELEGYRHEVNHVHVN